MTSAPNQTPRIVRTERGLTISGTRIMFYGDFAVLSHIKKIHGSNVWHN